MKVQGGEIKIIQEKTISNLHISLLCYFVIEALQFSNIYIPCDDHISLFPYPAPNTKLKAKLIFLDESTNSVPRSLFLFPFVLFLSWAYCLEMLRLFPPVLYYGDCPAQSMSVPISLSFLSPAAIYRLFTRAVRSLKSNLTMQIVSKYKPTLCKIFLILSSKLF